MKAIQFISITPEEFKKDLTRAVKEALGELEKENRPISKTEYLTQKEVASLLKIGKTTVYRWTKNGRLTSYGLGKFVYYKRAEVEDAIILLNPKT